uniref:Uncharacterized protein n=1 Tax=Leersia perrieri TaxID=77586 RepID=A0A0D9X0J0_9ORYZ
MTAVGGADLPVAAPGLVSVASSVHRLVAQPCRPRRRQRQGVPFPSTRRLPEMLPNRVDCYRGVLLIILALLVRSWGVANGTADLGHIHQHHHLLLGSHKRG